MPVGQPPQPALPSLPSLDPSPGAARLTGALRAGRQGRPVLGGCLTAGWPPDPGRRAEAWQALADHAGLIEIAIPTPMPRLDGPVISASHAEALAGGYSHNDAIDLAGSVAARGKPVVVMAYWHTLDADPWLAGELEAAGTAGFVVPDLPAVEAYSWTASQIDAGAHTILMADPGNPDALAAAGRYSTCAVYIPAAPGLTGTPARLRDGLARSVALAEQGTGLPAITGIGITSEDRAAAAAQSGAAAIIAGTAFARAAAGADPAAEIRDLAGRFTAAIAGSGVPPGYRRRPAPRRTARHAGLQPPAFRARRQSGFRR